MLSGLDVTFLWEVLTYSELAEVPLLCALKFLMVSSNTALIAVARLTSCLPLWTVSSLR